MQLQGVVHTLQREQLPRQHFARFPALRGKALCSLKVNLQRLDLTQLVFEFSALGA